MYSLPSGTIVPKSSDPPPKAPDFKVKARSEKILEWLQATEQAMQGLRRWANCLIAWDNEPPSDEDFMAAVQKMSELGLLDWMDGHPANLDALRDLVTEAVYPPPKVRRDGPSDHLKQQKFNPIERDPFGVPYNTEGVQDA